MRQDANVTLGLPAAGTIINDDSATVTINNVSKLESEGNFVFTATLSNPVDSNVSVEVYTQHGTGLVTDSDYNAVDASRPHHPELHPEWCPDSELHDHRQ